MLWVLKRTVSMRDGSSEHPKIMLKLMIEKIITKYAYKMSSVSMRTVGLYDKDWLLIT